MPKFRIAFDSDAVKLQRMRDKQLDDYLSSTEAEECDFTELEKVITPKVIKQVIKEWKDIENGDFSDYLDSELAKIQDVVYKYYDECEKEEIEEAIFGLIYPKFVKDRKMANEMVELFMF